MDQPAVGITVKDGTGSRALGICEYGHGGSLQSRHQSTNRH